jgi:hypothetical protein
MTNDRILSKVVALGVGAMTLATSTFAQPASDHLACYLVKDSVRKGTSTVTITNAGRHAVLHDRVAGTVRLP